MIPDVTYNGEHSITIGDYNTWTDWHLIPVSRPAFVMPQPVLRLLNIPGKSGSLDTTNLMGDTVLYGDRNGSFEFYVITELWPSWAEAWQTIANALHGQRLKAILDDDPNYYYEGRFSLNDFKSSQNRSTINISYVVAPYKRNILNYGEDWLWDDIVFDSSWVMPGIRNLAVVPTGTIVELEGFGYRTIPTIECSEAGVRVTLDNGTPVTMVKGSNTPQNCVIGKGKHTLRFYGSGTISVYYRGGSL